jgi:hypothetical protein
MAEGSRHIKNKFMAYLLIVCKNGSTIPDFNKVNSNLMGTPMFATYDSIKRTPAFRAVHGPDVNGLPVQQNYLKLEKLNSLIPTLQGDGSLLAVAERTTLRTKSLASSGVALKNKVNSRVMVKGAAIRGNSKTNGVLEANINEIGAIEGAFQTQGEILNALEAVRTSNKALLDSILATIVPVLMEKPVADPAVVATIEMLQFAATISNMTDVAVVANTCGFVFQPFYIVKTSKDYLFPVFENMATGAGSGADYDTGDAPIQTYRVSVNKILKNNSKVPLGTVMVNRAATIKSVLDGIKDANPSTRCMVSGGSMFITSLDPSAYYTQFYNLRLKYDQVELDLI